MKFAEMALAEAEGAILAHSVRHGNVRLKKGTLLEQAHLERLADAGVQTVVAARMERAEVGEDAAAETLACALAGDGVRVAAPFTGRCNLFAEFAGIVQIDPAQVNRLNRVHESLTAATVSPYQLVSARQMLATVKVIPFAVPAPLLTQAVAALGPERAVTVTATRFHRPMLIQTRLPGMRESILDKTRRVTDERLASLNARLAQEQRCDHQVDALSATLAGVLAAGADLVLVVGASAIVDRRDIIPVAIEACGGTVEHFGMPVDPGNLLLLARAGSAVVMGLPGCARSPSYNGFDQVLARVAAGRTVTSHDLMDLGVGGLLKDIPQRPQSRRRPGREPSAAPRVAAVVMAAGQSRRMGRTNKLLVPIQGKPMLQHVLDAVCASQVEWVSVVTGHEAEKMAEMMQGRGVKVVHNPHFTRGLSTTLARGLDTVPEEADAVLVCLGDMPRVTSRVIDRLIAAFDPEAGRSICVPTFGGKRGNPVLWDRRYVGEMRAVRGDVGARHLIGEFEHDVAEVTMYDDAVLTDVDSPEALQRLIDLNEA